jgi:hypothetical protein
MMHMLRDRRARPVRMARQVRRDIVGGDCVPGTCTDVAPDQKRPQRPLVIDDRVGREAALVAQGAKEISQRRVGRQRRAGTRHGADGVVRIAIERLPLRAMPVLKHGTSSE